MPRSFKLRRFKPKKNKLKTQKNHTKYNSHKKNKKNKKTEQIYNLDNNDDPFSDVAEPKMYHLRGGGRTGKGPFTETALESSESEDPFSTGVLDTVVPIETKPDIHIETKPDVPIETKPDVPIGTETNIPIGTAEESNEVEGDDSKELKYVKSLFKDGNITITETKMSEDELFKNLYENPEDFFYFSFEEEVGEEY